MRYEWNSGKALRNFLKHRIEFADAVIALEDENALTIEDKDHPEVRFKTLGMGSVMNILYVVHAQKDENCIRLISARKADKKKT